MEGGGGFVADGPLGVYHVWWLLRCSLLVVPLCIALCPTRAGLTTVCGAVLSPVALLRVFLPLWGCFFFWRCTHRYWCVLQGRGGGSVSLPASRCGCWVVPLSFGWHQGHPALLRMSPNMQTNLSLVFVGVVLW